MKPKRLLILTIVAAACSLFAAAPSPARAQDNLVPPEVVSLWDDINDIDKLRVINALKLSKEQLDLIVAGMKAYQVAYNKALVETVMPPLKEIAKDIKETRAKMLKGSGVPTDLDDKVKKIQDAFVKKRDSVEFNTLKGLSDGLKKILSSTQVSMAASLAKKATEIDGKPTAKGEDDKFFNLYVLNVFIRYPRIVSLLEDVRKAQTAESARTIRREARK